MIPSGESCSSDRSDPAPAGRSSIDLELMTFIHRYANTLLKWDLVMLFGANPYSGDHSEQIARRLGRPTGAVRRELEDLALLGLLRRMPAGDSPAFWLGDNPILRALTQRFVEHAGEV